MSVLLPPNRKQQSKLQQFVRRVAVAYSGRARAKRAELLRTLVPVAPSDRVLDLGGWDGNHIASLGLDADIYIADVNEDAVNSGAEKYGFTPVVIPESGVLPFPDGFFDLVFCSSVIEHVTIPNAELKTVTDTQEFRDRSRESQQTFAEEIRRIGKRYFVQTPYRYFPIESHTWMPGFIVALPRKAQIKLIYWANSWWPKPSVPDFYLLGVREMRSLFPEATIVRERSLGLTKSLMAVKPTR